MCTHMHMHADTQDRYIRTHVHKHTMENSPININNATDAFSPPILSKEILKFLNIDFRVIPMCPTLFFVLAPCSTMVGCGALEKVSCGPWPVPWGSAGIPYVPAGAHPRLLTSQSLLQIIMVRLQRVTFLALHNYLGLTTELFNPVSASLPCSLLSGWCISQ